MKGGSDEEDEGEINWQDDVDIDVQRDCRNDEEKEDEGEEEGEEDIEWLDDVYDDPDEAERCVKNVRTLEPQEETSIVINLDKRDDQEGIVMRKNKVVSSKDEKGNTKACKAVTRKRKLSFTRQHEIRARENHKALLEQAIYNLKQQHSLFFDDHVVATLQSILPEHLLFRSHKVCI